MISDLHHYCGEPLFIVGKVASCPRCDRDWYRQERVGAEVTKVLTECEGITRKAAFGIVGDRVGLPDFLVKVAWYQWLHRREEVLYGACQVIMREDT